MPLITFQAPDTEYFSPMNFHQDEHHHQQVDDGHQRRDYSHVEVFVEPGGSHRARISTLPEAEKKQAMELINEWLK